MKIIYYLIGFFFILGMMLWPGPTAKILACFVDVQKKEEPGRDVQELEPAYMEMIIGYPEE